MRSVAPKTQVPETPAAPAPTSPLQHDESGYYVSTQVSGKEIFRRLKATEEGAARWEAEKLLADLRRRMRNLWLRGGVWYVVAKIHGRRISRSLEAPEAERDLARTKARAVIAAARERRWEALDDTKLRKGYATLGELVRVFKAEAARHDLRPLTVTNYVSCLGLVLDKTSVAEVSTELLSEKTVDAYVARKLAEETPANRARLRRSINSTVNQARGLFGEDWAMGAYKKAGLRLPASIEDFRDAFVVEAPLKRYVMTEERKRLLAKTHQAAAAFRGENSDLWPVYLLCYYLAMRAGEAAAARWAWIVADPDGRSWMQVINRPGEFRAKGSEGKIPIPKQVVTWLEELRRRRGGDFILPGPHKTARRALVVKTFAAWMRTIGWDAARYPKAAHELRAARGSEWYTLRGLEAAAKWLRHKDPATTVRFYADFTSQPPTLEVGE